MCRRLGHALLCSQGKRGRGAVPLVYTGVVLSLVSEGGKKIRISIFCDSHGCSRVGHGAGGRSGAPQQPPWLTPIQFDTSILTVEPVTVVAVSPFSTVCACLCVLGPSGVVFW